MILPIVAYGTPVLKQKGAFIDSEHPGLKELIANMFETMYHAPGVGLAAPQVGHSIRLFVLDASPFSDEHPELDGVKKVFINAEIVEESGDDWKFNEGCLSIPHIREDVDRKPTIRMKYQDENFNSFEETFDGILARIIQHEYDHIDGILFTDRLSQLRRTLLRGKLQDISKGRVKVDYRMKFTQLRR
ncbi:MAG TPA: peptide deformylase [Flavobacteriales bacterium]|nr:peptide deformylase [Flavobacteriales bacterium]HPH83439.1 peptide deformylase [Flavobacteriales bacterium]